MGILDTIYLKVILLVTHRIQKTIELNFLSNKRKAKPLYVTYTQLACRKSTPSTEADIVFDSTSNEIFNNSSSSSSTTLSSIGHPIHADNCILLPNGTCSHNPPAFTWRDYSTILYLNDDFDGGDFIFANDFYGKDVSVIIINLFMS